MFTRATEAHVRANAGTVPPSATCDEAPTSLDLNAVVAFNVRAIRLVRGWTQDQVAERLAEFTGHRLPQASISQMERSFVDRECRRLFNAQDLYLLSKVFEVPIVYFFLPPPTCLDQTVASTGEPVSSLLDSVFGTPTSLRAVDSRLVEIEDESPDAGTSRSPRHPARKVSTWRHHLSRVSEVDCNARLREIANLLQELSHLHRADDGVGPASSAHL
ncbi:MAG: helix-turn-helix domain-containing protein [Acidimicrobiia bacterium]